VRSRRQYAYDEAHEQVEAGRADEPLQLLREVGLLRLERERERGGVSLSLPDQEVVVSDHTWMLEFRRVLPVEDWNAQISLLTGMGAAEVMLYGEQGIVRTLPAAPDGSLARLRRTAAALKLPWPHELDYPGFVRTVNPNTARGAAMLNACAALFRGAGYVAFDGTVPPHHEHAALASAYAHVTAPLRRLVDRYAGEVAVALCTGKPTPEWVRAALPGLPAEMQHSDQAAKRYERAIVDMVEAGLLQGRVGQQFEGSVVDVDDKNPRRGTVMLLDPAVEAPVSSQHRLPLGATVTVQLTAVDVQTRTVGFDLVGRR
jgi:exoribonuclease R